MAITMWGGNVCDVSYVFNVSHVSYVFDIHRTHRIHRVLSNHEVSERIER